MAKRLIDAEKFLQWVVKRFKCVPLVGSCDNDSESMSLLLAQAPTVDAVELPCKIGDYVWAIRNFKGHKHPLRGVVSNMYFTRDMKLNIVVKYVARGKWGETVFATDAEAYAVINGERKEG